MLQLQNGQQLKMPQKRDNETIKETIKSIDDRIVLRIQFTDDQGQVTFDSGFVDTGVAKEVYISGIQAQIDGSLALIQKIEEA